MEDKEKKELYDEFRDLAFSTKPKDIGIKDLPEREIAVFGMIMEMGYEEGIATMVTYKTGDASMYYSGGGAFINGASHPEIKKAAEEFVKSAQDFVKYAEPVSSKDFPAANAIGFHFLTNKGVLFAEETMEKFGSAGSPWLPLFKAGNRVISEINMHSSIKIKHKYIPASYGKK